MTAKNGKNLYLSTILKVYIPFRLSKKFLLHYEYFTFMTKKYAMFHIYQRQIYEIYICVMSLIFEDMVKTIWLCQNGSRYKTKLKEKWKEASDAPLLSQTRN